MKKIILICSAIFCYCGSFAQIDSTNSMNHDMNNNRMNNNKMENNQKMDPVMNQQQMDKSHPDGVMMQGGKMVMVKNGKITAMDREMTLNNGTKVMNDGSYVTKEGAKMRMKEGQHMDMSGNIIPMKNSQNSPDKSNVKSDKDKMYVVPDSTIKK